MSQNPSLRASPNRIVLAVLCLAQLMLIVDVVIVNVALPVIRAGLGIPDARLAFTSITYTLTFGSLLIVAGRAGDLFGRRRLLLAGMAVFTVGSLLSGAAQADWQLFAARAVQGAGAAAVSPNALAIITATFAEGSDRNRALGWWGAVGSAGAIAGQLLGGVVTALAGWRWIFLINVPIGLAAIVIAMRVLPRDEATRETRLDLAGALSLASGLGALTWALSSLAESGPDARFIATLATGILLLIVFAGIERRAQDPLVRFGLLRNGSVRAGNVVLALSAGAVGGALFFTSLHLQLVLGYSALAVGALFAPVTVIVLLVSPVAGRLIEPVGLRRLLAGGMAIAGLGLLLLASAPALGSLPPVMVGLALVALGSGLSYAPTFIAGTSGVAEQEQGLASGLLSTSQELGAALGLATLGAIAASAGAGTGLADAYRAGYLGAFFMVVIGVLVALRIPPENGAGSDQNNGEADGPIASKDAGNREGDRGSERIAEAA